MHQEVKPPRQAAERYVAWRALCLRNAGIGASEATRLACNPDFDLHALLELLDRGCRADLAVRILAPHSWEPLP